MEEYELVEKFFLENYKEYDSTMEEFESYEIDGCVLTIKHHTKNGKELTSEFTVWEVMATLLNR